MTIVSDILKQMPGVRQPQRKFLAMLFATILALRGRVVYLDPTDKCCGPPFSRHANIAAPEIMPFSPPRAYSAEGRRPSTGPEKRSAPRAGQRLGGVVARRGRPPARSLRDRNRL